MAQWTDRFTNHPIWNHFENLGPAIDNALNREEIDPQTTEGLARLKAVLTFTGRRLAGADPFILHFGSLDNLGNQFQSIIQEVQNFTANGNAGHITNANSNADTALTTLAQLHVPLTTDDFLSAKEAAETYRKGLDNVLVEVRNSFAQTQKELDSIKSSNSELSVEITTEKKRLADISAEFQTKFSTDQDTRTREFTATQKEQQECYNNLLNEFKQKLVEQNTDFTKQREDIARTHQQALEDLKEEFTDSASKLRDEIAEHKANVEKLVGVIGNLGVTSGYLTTANEAKTTVRVWQGITVTAMIGLIVIAIVAFLPILGGTFSWGSFAGRVFISLTFGVLAAYAASQADKYQKIERQNRRIALELEAIGPFIAPLPLEKQEEFRLTIGDRSFGHGDGVHTGLDAKSPATISDVLLQSKEFRSFVTEIVKAAKS